MHLIYEKLITKMPSNKHFEILCIFLMTHLIPEMIYAFVLSASGNIRQQNTHVSVGDK